MSENPKKKKKKSDEDGVFLSDEDGVFLSDLSLPTEVSFICFSLLSKYTHYLKFQFFKTNSQQVAFVFITSIIDIYTNTSTFSQ